MKFKREPYDYQLKGLELSKDKPNYALFMEQGTGKTKVTLDTANYLYNQGEIDTMLVVAWPNGVHRNWVDIELAKDLTVPYLATFWQSNLSKKKKEEIKTVYTYKDGLRVMTYNIEAVNTQNCKDNIKAFLKTGKVLFVIDQSACIKTPKAKRTQALIKMSKHPNVMFKRILDGDPVAEGLHEYYSQFRFLDPKIIGVINYKAFKYEYCVFGKHNNIAGYRNEENLNNLIKPYYFRCRADECLDLPDRVYKRWIFDLNKDERRMFDQMKEEAVTYLTHQGEDYFNYEKLALTKNLRLQQITSGWFNTIKESVNKDKGDEGLEAEEKKVLLPISAESSRFKAFRELVKQAKGKVLVFARFVADIKLLEELLGDEAVSYHGGVSEDDKAEAKRAFMEDDKTRFFIGQPSTAGIGHTLTSAKHIVFYSNSHSLRLRKECEKRVHRSGLKHKVIIWDLVAKNTQDAKIIQCLIDKKKISDEIMKDPASFFMQEV